MHLIGNDVVDLADPDARSESSHPRFRARVFTERELSDIEGSAEPERRHWQLWAAKEAAAKALLGWQGVEIEWRHFEVHAGSERFEVHWREHTIGGWWLGPESGVVHAVCAAGVDPDSGEPRVRPLAPEETRAVRSFLTEVDLAGLRSDPEFEESRLVRAWCLERLRALTGARDGVAAIMETPAGVPYLSFDGVRRGRLSLSHHGAYLAAAFFDGD